MSDVAGIYHYHRIGHDERVMELCPNGSIGIGADGAEQTWELSWFGSQQQLSICGDYGEICRMKREPDGTTGTQLFRRFSRRNGGKRWNKHQ